MKMPDFSLEDQYDAPVCGMDEAGRGPLAGPVVAACVHIPDSVRAMTFISEVTDSKKLSKAKLKTLSALIKEHCIFGIAHISPQEIDQINIHQASLKAMATTLKLTPEFMPKHALVDGRHCPKDLPCSATSVIRGDAKSKSIAAASILAKYERDQLMKQLAETYPHYSWETNAGYPTKQHIAGIQAHGITPHHRTSFKPVAEFLSCGKTTCQTRLVV